MNTDSSKEALDPERLASFAAFAEHLNFTRAARARHLSQPAVHAHVKRLGAQLGVSLYRRRGRTLELTAEGREVAAFARELAERSELLRRRLHAERDAEPAVICAGEGAYLYLLGDAIRRYGARDLAPLEVMTRDADGTLEAVLTGRAHVGVLPLARDAPLPSALVAEPIAEVGHVLAFPTAHPLAARRRLRLVDLAGAALLVPPRGRPLRRTIERALADIPWQVAVEVSGWPLMLHFAALGIGLAIVNDFCRLPRTLSALPLPQLGALTYCAVRRAERREGAGAQLLWRLLVGA
ncbi:MAG: LysR family transcriptional regulator [Myxococcales bacterium]|nr:LysR family transcriptional regulator [Myxococcales bacterium]